MKENSAAVGIQDLKLAELEISRINRALKLLTNCNEKLIRAEHEQDLLDQICRIAVENGGYRMVWVGYAQDDDSRSITPSAHAGVEEDYLSEITVTWNKHEPLGQGPAGQVIRSGRAVVCEDLSREKCFAPWLALAQERSYRGLIGLPLRDGEQTFGWLGLYSAEVHPTSAEELKLLQELADNLAFGILNLRSRMEQLRVQTAVLKVAASVSAATGTEFFEQLARNMAEALGGQASFVAQLLPGEPATARTVAAVMEGRVTDNFDYVIKGTACESLLRVHSCVIPKQLGEQFPLSSALAALGAQGYVGRRLISSSGETLGFLFVIFREPLKQVEFITSTLQIFAARAASELERRQTDAQVREQAALLDITHEAIYVIDLESRILYWNKGAEKTYGWNSTEVLGRKSHEIFLQDSAGFREAQAELMARGVWQGETSKRTKDGRDLTVEVRWTLVRDAQGQPKSILAVNTDITERKQLEEQFFRAQRLESIGTLASGLAHDLNNVLAPILMCAPFLRRNLPPDQLESFVTAIESSATRGAQIVSQVLTFGRGAEGERQPLQLAAIIQEVVQIARETFPKNIRIEHQLASDLCEIIGDATQWHQVLLNLSVNARDAMPDGGVLGITAENLAVDAHYASMIEGLSEGPHLALAVSDTGTGIPPKIAERIFDPFFTTKEIGKGTGLGLSTVLGIVKSHGAVISLTSRPGSGTTFRMIIPTAAAPTAAQVSQPKTALPAGCGETVLIADDEENVRNAARTVLELNGYRTLVAADGAAALAVYAQHAATIDAVLTDITMPFMDGVALIRALRRMQPSLPVIASTGHGENAQVAELKTLGCALILKKPYTAELLLRTLKTALRAAGEKTTT